MLTISVESKYLMKEHESKDTLYTLEHTHTHTHKQAHTRTYPVIHSYSMWNWEPTLANRISCCSFSAMMGSFFTYVKARGDHLWTESWQWQCERAPTQHTHRHTSDCVCNVLLRILQSTWKPTDKTIWLMCETKWACYHVYVCVWVCIMCDCVEIFGQFHFGHIY